MKIIKYLIFTLLINYMSNVATPQDDDQPVIEVNGFIKNDFFFDSRQTFASREGHFLFWPLPKLSDSSGNDINAKSNFNFLAIQSRLTVRINGGEFLGAKTMGLIEGDFFAQANDNINLFRLRHGYVRLEWKRWEILTGQYWNPLFIEKCYPGTISFNTGTPLQSFARNPQIRIIYKPGKMRLMAAALSQRDYSTYGMEGASSSYLRNADFPDIHFRAEIDNDFIFGGADVSFKRIVPRLSSAVNGYTYKVHEEVNSLAVEVFSKIWVKPVSIKLEGRYGENISEVLSISGFAVKEVLDTLTGKQSYTPLKNITLWGETSVKLKNFEFGFFGGILKNIGTKEKMSDAGNPVYGLATDIDILYRLSPRILYFQDHTKIGCELEYTNADYGTNFDSEHRPANTTNVANLRVLLSIYYLF